MEVFGLDCLLYDEQRYHDRGKFAEARFERICLAEYAEVPDDFRFTFKPAASRTPYDPDGSVDRARLGYHAWALDPPRLVPGVSDFCDDANRAPQHRGGVDARHDAYANTVFLDGHVENLKPAQLGYVLAGFHSLNTGRFCPLADTLGGALTVNPTAPVPQQRKRHAEHHYALRA